MSAPIQLYSLATPNGQKVGIALEEMDLEYEAHTINIMEGDQFEDSFIKINPNSKIPAILVTEIEGEAPWPIMESGAILLYLAEKTGKFLPTDPKLRNEVLQWLFFQMGGPGPMFGQFGHFYKSAKDACSDPYPVERYAKETKRLLEVLETRLKDRSYLVGEAYSIADMAIVPWVNCLTDHYEASDYLGLSDFPNVMGWAHKISQREKTQKGMTVCGIN
jgi:GST-like protein